MKAVSNIRKSLVITGKKTSPILQNAWSKAGAEKYQCPQISTMQLLLTIPVHVEMMKDENVVVVKGCYRQTRSICAVHVCRMPVFCGDQSSDKLQNCWFKLHEP
jgi:hypothetical protein